MKLFSIKNGLSKICGKQPLKYLKWYGLLKAAYHKYFVPMTSVWKYLLRSIYIFLNEAFEGRIVMSGDSRSQESYCRLC